MPHPCPPHRSATLRDLKESEKRILEQVALLGGKLATTQAVAKAKREILRALGERVDPKRLQNLTTDLREAAEPLAQAVADNKPISS
jgi:hypothetical protein